MSKSPTHDPLMPSTGHVWYCNIHHLSVHRSRLEIEGLLNTYLLTRNRYLELFLIGLRSAPMDPFVITAYRPHHLASLFHSHLACSLECVLCYGKRLIGLLMAHGVSLSFTGCWEAEFQSACCIQLLRPSSCFYQLF